jgi:NAD(P)H dehydrogenase (quinone)
MSNVLVLYYSSYGHIERMTYAEADGARSGGAEVDIKRVPELVPDDVALAAHYKLDQIAPVAELDDLLHYDGIIFGTPTRFGNMSAQMKNFIDQAGRL